MKTWVIQSSGINDSETRRAMDACYDLKVPYTDVGLIPFTDKIVGIEKLDPFGNYFFYGSTKLVKLIMQTDFRKFIYYDEAKFNTACWNQSRDDMLNQHAEVMEMREFVDMNGLYFVRPYYDLKSFSGQLVEDFKYDWFDQVSYQQTHFGEDLLVSVSKPQNILSECRYFIVNRKIVAGSLYRTSGRLTPGKITIGSAAQAYADKWLPNDNVVMDVAFTKEGKAKVVEFNCINCSGFYASDVQAIVNNLE